MYTVWPTLFEDKTVVSDICTQCSQQCARIKLLSLIYWHSVANSVWGYEMDLSGPGFGIFADSRQHKFLLFWVLHKHYFTRQLASHFTQTFNALTANCAALAVIPISCESGFFSFIWRSYRYYEVFTHHIEEGSKYVYLRLANTHRV